MKLFYRHPAKREINRGNEISEVKALLHVRDVVLSIMVEGAPRIMTVH